MSARVVLIEGRPYPLSAMARWCMVQGWTWEQAYTYEAYRRSRHRYTCLLSTVYHAPRTTTRAILERRP